MERLHDRNVLIAGGADAKTFKNSNCSKVVGVLKLSVLGVWVKTTTVKNNTSTRCGVYGPMGRFEIPP